MTSDPTQKIRRALAQRPSFFYNTPAGQREYFPCSPETAILIDEVVDRGGKFWTIPDTDIVFLELNGIKKCMRKRLLNDFSAFAVNATLNKYITEKLLQHANVSMVKSILIRRADDQELIQKAFEAISKPLVVKPTHGALGASVFVDISDYEKYLQAVQHSFSHFLQEDSGVLVEEHFQGEEYRVLASRDKIMAVMKRIPCEIIGNGIDTISLLIENENKSELRNIHQELYPHMKLDSESDELLRQQNLTMDSIPAAGQIVKLKKVSNIMSGGIAVDVTDEVHPSVKDIATKVIRSIPGLAYGGIDFMTTDIQAEQTPDKYRIIEVNYNPGFAMHCIPMRGKARDVGGDIIDVFFSPHYLNNLGKIE